MQGSRTLSRGRVLAWAGGLGLAAFLPGCGSDSDGGGSASPTTAASATTETTTTVPGCVLTPELTEGPYYLDLDQIRSDIAEDREGLPFELRIVVVDADARGDAETSNSADGIFGQSGGTTIVDVEVRDASCSGSVTLGVQRA